MNSEQNRRISEIQQRQRTRPVEDVVDIEFLLSIIEEQEAASGVTVSTLVPRRAARLR